MSDTVVTKKHIFQELKGSRAFQILSEHAEKMIAQEKQLFWDDPDSDDAVTQRIKATHFQEFWNQLKVFITNTANQ